VDGRESVMSGDTGNENVYMWLTPDPAAEPDIATADAHTTVAMNDGFNKVRLQMNGSSAFSVKFDEIRLGESYTNVASELSSSSESNILYSVTGVPTMHLRW